MGGVGRGFGTSAARLLWRGGLGGLLRDLLLLARLDRGGAGLEPEAVRLADHRIAADSAKLVGDLAGGRAVVPHLLQALDAFFSPGH